MNAPGATYRFTRFHEVAGKWNMTFANIILLGKLVGLTVLSENKHEKIMMCTANTRMIPMRLSLSKEVEYENNHIILK